MINIIMLSPHVQAINYGIGAYKRQLKKGFSDIKEVNLHILRSHSKELKEFTIESEGNGSVTYYNIPHFFENVNVTESDNSSERYTTYIRNIALLLSPYLRHLENKILHVNFPAAMQMAKILKECYNVPLVSVVHFSNWQLWLNGNKKLLDKIWGKYLEKQTLSSFEGGLVRELLKEKELYEISDKIISVTQYMKRFVEKYYAIWPGKITVVRNGICLDEAIGRPHATRQQLRSQWYIDENEKIIVFSGRISNQKGVEYLLAAFRQLLKSDSQCRLFIIGDGSITSSLSQCRDIWTKVSFTGYADFSIVQQLYRIADLGVIPSLYDHCPYVALELMKYEVPIITSNTEGLNEILADNYDCLYVSQREDDDGNLSIDSVKLAELMSSILQNKQLSTRLQESAWKTLLRGHSLASMTDSTLSIYKDAIEN